MAVYDVIVLGLGGMGSATAYHLARRGSRVLGLEQFGVAHDQGSSHGRTRVIRQAYYEGQDYVPLLFRAYDLWHVLEREAGTKLLTTTGAIYFGPPGVSSVAGAAVSARAHNIPHEILTADDIRKGIQCSGRSQTTLDSSSTRQASLCRSSVWRRISNSPGGMGPAFTSARSSTPGVRAPSASEFAVPGGSTRQVIS